MSGLSLALLGTPEIRHGASLVRFPTRKAAALMIYLAVEGGRHSREKIATLLWPESDVERSRGSLRTTLGHLRATLHPETDHDSRPHLATDSEALSLDLGPDDALDLNVLREALAVARSPVHGPPREVIARLRAATQVDRGDFLDGFSPGNAPAFDDWASVQRETWLRRMGQVYDRLSRELSEGGALSEAIDVTARWVAREPLNETAHRRLMRLYVAVDDRPAALRAYEACRAILVRELNAEPAPETTALAERIRTTPRPRRVRQRDGAPEGPADAPLVGRLSEHATLVAAYRATRRGQTSAVLIHGEAGIGKTRLATAFLAWAKAQGATVIAGRAFEVGSSISYHPIVEALRGWLAGDDDPGQLLGEVWLAELARLLPDLRERFPDLPPPLSLGENEARTRLYDSVTRLGLALAKRGALVVFLDDLHWADAASRELLLYAARQWASARAPVLAVVSSRAEELDLAPWSAEWLAAFGHDVPVTQIGLGPLSREDTASLIAQFGVTDATAADWLYAESGGQPFFAIEMAKAWREKSGESSATSAPSGLLPPGVQEVIRSRLARLSSPARDVLTAAAILGDDFAFETARTVAGVDENAALAALDELLARRLLHELDTTYRFGHDKFREVVYGEAGEARRRVYHRRALDALDTQSRPAAELARHAYAAGLLDRAAELSLRAGDEALRVFAVRDAIASYQRGLEWRRRPLDSSDASIIFQLGRAYELTSQYAAARDLYEQLLSLASQAGDPKLEGAALNRLALVAMLGAQPDLDTGSAALQRALGVAEASGDVEGLAETESNLSRFSFYRFDIPATHAHGVRALSSARELGRTELIARSLNWLALTEVHLGQWRTAQTRAEEAAQLFHALGDRAMEADSLVQLAAARIRFGQLHGGIAAARQARELSVEIENRWGEADANRELALGLLERGEYGAALDTARAAVTSARAAEYPPLRIICLAVYGAICRRLGLLDDARAAHAEILAIGQGMGYPPFVELAMGALCADCAVLGDWVSAADYARSAVQQRTWAVSFNGLTRWHETEALVHAGDAARATDDVQHFRQFIGENRRYRIPYLRCLAVLAESNRELTAATSSLLEARSLAVELGLPGELHLIETALARLASQQGDTTSAQAHRSRAREIGATLAESIPDEDVRRAFLIRSVAAS